MKKLLFILLFLAISLPVNASKEQELKKVEKEISKHKKISSDLEKKAKANEVELKNINKKSIEVAKSLQVIEKHVDTIQTDLSDLTAIIKIKEMQLEKNKENAKALLSSLMRISNIPVGGFVVASDNPQEVINTRILLNTAMPYLMEQANKLQDDIMDIENSKEEVLVKKQEITKLSETTKKEMEELKNLLDQKNKLKNKLTEEQKKEKNELNKLAKKASSMKDFLEKLKARKVNIKPGVKPTFGQKTPIIFTKTKGKLPVSGKIKLAFGQKNEVDVTNKGWEIIGKPGSVVTCPIEGDVLYSGDFSGYKNLIVFDNGNGYNLLLAGMEKINIEVGDRVKAGEPIGFLKTDSPELYLEVRKDGNPIDPVKVLK